MFSWAPINTMSVTNSGLLSVIGGGASAPIWTNSGTIYISNGCCSIAPEPLTGINVGTGASNPIGYNQFADGVLKEVLTAPTSYGQVLAGPWLIPAGGLSGSALEGYAIHLDGTLDIMLGNGFTPLPRESFLLFETAPGDISGTFSDVMWDSFDNGRGMFTVFYDNAAGDVIINAELVPEQSSIALIGLSLPMLWWWVRRQIRKTYGSSSRRSGLGARRGPTWCSPGAIE
ncbi:MAG: hypothetical protein JO061_13935 [Acidobacteriaceae bacterium]|nr:hypothetical protein [Acidobacteriaceae bacterium]